MSGQEQHNNKTLDQAMALMEQSDALSNDDITKMLSDEDITADVRSLWTIKKAIDNHEVQVPDADAEWKKFCKREDVDIDAPHHHNTYLYYILSAAAIAVILVLIPWHRLLNPPVSPQMAMKTAMKTRDVVITSDDGKEVILGKQSAATIGNGVAQQGQGVVVYANYADGKKAVHTITIPPGKTFKVVLADGSEVWLNAGSQLTYPTVFGDTRDVELQGEAYFKVKHDAAHPFTVKAGNVLTRVLGTEFNVRCVNNQPVHVTLIKGLVNVSTQDHQSVTIHPGEDATPDANGSFSIHNVDTQSLTYWKDGYFYYDNTPLYEIMDDIGPWFNVKVVFRNPAARRYRMHIFFDRHHLDEAISQINMMEKVHVKKLGDTLIIE